MSNVVPILQTTKLRRDPEVATLVVARPEGMSELDWQARIDTAWGAARPLLEPAVARTNRLTLEDVYAFLREGGMQLFLFATNEALLGALVTEISDYPKARVLTMCFLGGSEAQRWLDCVYDVEAWAKEHGCTQIEAVGRHGWMRALRGAGYAPLHWTVAKEIQ